MIGERIRLMEPRQQPLWLRIVLNLCGPLGLAVTLMGWVKPSVGIAVMAVGGLYVAWELYPSAQTYSNRRPFVSLTLFCLVGAVAGAGVWAILKTTSSPPAQAPSSNVPRQVPPVQKPPAPEPTKSNRPQPPSPKARECIGKIQDFIQQGQSLLGKANSSDNSENLNTEWGEWLQSTRQWLGIHLSIAHENSFDRTLIVPAPNASSDEAAKIANIKSNTTRQIEVLQRFQKKLKAYGMPVPAPPGSRCAYPVPVTVSAAQPVNNQYAYGIRVSFTNPHGIFAFTNYQIWTKGNIRLMIPNAENRPSMGASWAGTNMPPNFGFLSIQSDIKAGTPVNIELYSDGPIDLECIDEIP